MAGSGQHRQTMLITFAVSAIVWITLQHMYNQKIESVLRTHLRLIQCEQGKKGSCSLEVIDGKSYLLPEEISFRLPWADFSLPDSANTSDAQANYMKSVQRLGAECRKRARVGNIGNGGWDVCLAGPYNLKHGCLVYDFGIRKMWSFDDEIAQKYGCKVKAFDPAMGVDQHRRGTHIFFYPLGLSGEEGKIRVNGQRYSALTLQQLLEKLGDEDKVIDYLKIDIDSNEWTTLSSLLNYDLLPRYVKQLALELHGFGSVERVNILHSLHKMGFRKWLHNWNHNCIEPVKIASPIIKKKYFPWCNEIYYININFLQKQ